MQTSDSSGPSFLEQYDQLLTVAEGAKLFGISADTFRKSLKEDDLGIAVMIGTQWRISEKLLKRMLWGINLIPDQVPERFINLEETARFLRVTPTTLRSIAESGQLFYRGLPLGDKFCETWRFKARLVLQYVWQVEFSSEYVQSLDLKKMVAGEDRTTPARRSRRARKASPELRVQD